MEKPNILHLFTPAAQASPFDVNMAYDAGYQAVVPYTGMRVADVTTLTQDAIFSRGPKGVKRTGIFFRWPIRRHSINSSLVNAEVLSASACGARSTAAF